MRERAHDQKIFIFLYKNPLYFRLYLAIINSGDEKLDTTVSGVVGFKVVAAQYKKINADTIKCPLFLYPAKAQGQPIFLSPEF